MREATVFFNDALREAIGILLKAFPADKIPLVIRDIYGRIRIAFNEESKVLHGFEEKLAEEWVKLGHYGQYEGKKVLSKDDFFDPSSVFESPDILTYQPPESEKTIQILDRQITGQEWTRIITLGMTTPRLVFHGIKGGVGRSTAIAVLAYHLAKKGKQVLIIDFDLESPGLSGLMLPPDLMAEFGIVDWFVEDGVGQGNEILPRMLSICPLSQAEGVTGRRRGALGRTKPTV